MDSLLTEIQHHLNRRAGGAYPNRRTVFSNQHGLLGRTDTAEEMSRYGALGTFYGVGVGPGDQSC